MKLVEYKKAISKRSSILLANIKFTYQIETAFHVNNWANVLSTCFYTLSMILFINVLYSNVKLVAGYSKDEMLLFMFIGQAGYYLSWLIHSNLEELIFDVNKGRLDMLLIRPVPSLFYVTFKKVRLFSIIRDCLPPMIVLAFAINWTKLPLSVDTFLGGFFVTLLGIICVHVVHFFATIPVFWLGESRNILNFSQEFEYNLGKVIPFEGFNKNFQLFFVAIIPVMISAGLATSVILGKTPAIPAIIISLIVTCLSLVMRQLVWKMALQRYTSASS
jgi:ABC-2 type transport system permease protein